MKISFDRFTFDAGQRLLLDDGTPIHLPPKTFRLLEILITSRPRALAKAELTNAIWPDVVVEESNLAGLVADLRDTLGDDARKPRFIRTVHGFGYSFCGDVAGAAPRVRAATMLYRGDVLPLYRGENILGRDPSADVQVDDSTVSRRHARLWIGDDGITIEDLDSKNGTLLDEEKVTAATPLRDGQTVTLGDARLVFRRSTASGSTVTASGRRV